VSCVDMALGLSVALAGCSTATPTTELEPSPVAPTQPASPRTASETSTRTPSPTAAEVVGPKGVVAYPMCDRQGADVWSSSCRIGVVNADGTDAHQLVPHELDPEKPRYLHMPDDQYPLAWSPDGSRLYYRFERVEYAGPGDGVGRAHSGVAVTDAVGSKPVELLDLLGDKWCGAYNCNPDRDGMVISPDGRRLAYTFTEGDDANISTIVVLDVASERITPLPSTRTMNRGILPNEGPNEPCTAEDGGYNGALQWRQTVRGWSSRAQGSATTLSSRSTPTGAIFASSCHSSGGRTWYPGGHPTARASCSTRRPVGLRTVRRPDGSTSRRSAQTARASAP
jgi:hypothetical protein